MDNKLLTHFFFGEKKNQGTQQMMVNNFEILSCMKVKGNETTLKGFKILISLRNEFSLLTFWPSLPINLPITLG